ncbi:MAG TPA: hypothetical protein VMT83_18625 [Burkholderiaceae bacterium]|nr:hypothetical protein [Burkholderiaceae bacterium]
MDISREEASSSLREIGQAHRRSTVMQNYRHFAPHMLVWGCVWLLANGLCDFYPDQVGLIWPVASIVGVIVSLANRKRVRGRLVGTAAGMPGSMLAQGWRWVLAAAVLYAFFVATFNVLPPGSTIQATTFISLFFMFAYMIYGALAGLRVFFIGLIATIAILYGYFSMATHQFMWLGVAAGGALIVGALWVRKT